MDLAKAIDGPDDQVPLLLGNSMSSAYIASLNNLDAASTAQQLAVPMLFMQGRDDRQVGYDTDYGEWKKLLAGKGNVTFKEYSNLSHFFWPGEGSFALDDINAGAKVNQQVIDDLAAWIIDHA